MTTRLTNNIEHIGIHFDVERYNREYDTDYLGQIYNGRCIKTQSPYMNDVRIVSVGLGNGKVLWWCAGAISYRSYNSCYKNYTQDDIDFLKDHYYREGAAYCAKWLGRSEKAITIKARKLGLLLRKV